MELSNEALLVIKLVKEKIYKLLNDIAEPPDKDTDEAAFFRGYQTALRDIANDIEDIEE